MHLKTSFTAALVVSFDINVNGYAFIYNVALVEQLEDWLN